MARIPGILRTMDARAMDAAPAALGNRPRPLVLTLGVDEASQGRLEAERRRYYPARLNRIPAHVSLFHALPGEEERSVGEELASLAATEAPFAVEVYDLMRLGRGVAYSVRAPELARLHARLRAAWLPWLSPQDRQGFRPHVVVQNKADPGEARGLYERLSASFRPWTIKAESLLLWYYEGGPWTPAGQFPLGARRGGL